MEGGAVGHNFERDPPRDHPCQVWINFTEKPGIYVKLLIAM
jgi:hypothetical protein